MLFLVVGEWVVVVLEVDLFLVLLFDLMVVCCWCDWGCGMLILFFCLVCCSCMWKSFLYMFLLMFVIILLKMM